MKLLLVDFDITFLLNWSESKRRKLEDDVKEVSRSDGKDKNHVEVDKKEKSTKLDRKRVSIQANLFTYVILSFLTSIYYLINVAQLPTSNIS